MASDATMIKEMHGEDRHKHILAHDLKPVLNRRKLDQRSPSEGRATSNDGSSSTRNQSPTPTPSLRSPASDPNDDTITGPPKTGDSYFNPFGLRRVESMSTLSRASFSSQLSQLASLQLPQAASLASTISAMPAAVAAARALSDAAVQIRDWIKKAAQVLGDLDAEDDVEWAAAGGRDGLTEVDNAVRQFEGLVRVYVGAIDELRSRRDISSVPVEQLKSVVTQMEEALDEWEGVGKLLKQVKQQVELAMEWEELLNVVLGDIGAEIEELASLVFEMEEKRHRSLMEDMAGDDNVDLGELATIAEEVPIAARQPDRSRSRPSVSSAQSPLQSPTIGIAEDDSGYLALFARMQPLKASLDFLPMRLTTFISRAEPIFPTACDELESRRLSMEEELRDLQRDADSLRKELGEDRWVLVFRNAGRQAQKMCQLVSRSLIGLREAIEAGHQHTNPSAMAKRVESYESKKIHYGPAIERVLAIIARGVHDRVTVNGEILRLRADAEAQWKSLEVDIKAMDGELETLSFNKGQQMRDSISTIISLDPSAAGSSIDTPGSSPASSIVMNGSSGGVDPGTPLSNAKLRPHNTRTSSLPRPQTDRRYSSLPSVSQLTMQAPTRKIADSGLSNSPMAIDRTASPSRYLNRASATPTPGIRQKPRWKNSVRTVESPIGQSFKPLASTTLTPQRQISNPRSTTSSIERPSSSSRDRSESPGEASPSLRHSFYGTNRVSASPARQSFSRLESAPVQRLRNRVSTSQLTESISLRPRIGRVETLGRHASPAMTPMPAGPSTPARQKMSGRPASAMASGRRSSLLPMPMPMPLPKPSPTRTSTVGAGGTAMSGQDRHRLLLRPGSQLSTAGRASPTVSHTGDPSKARPAWR